MCSECRYNRRYGSRLTPREERLLRQSTSAWFLENAMPWLIVVAGAFIILLASI